MRMLEIIKGVSQFLNKEKCLYCLAGGHAASMYRAQERFTRDVDFALTAAPISASEYIANGAIKKLGLKPIAAFLPSVFNEKKTTIASMITSVPTQGEAKGIVDIILPSLPWVSAAVERAQHNTVDLGFADVPLITPEDLIIAKSYSVHHAPDRFLDLDDLKEIFGNIKDLDIDYIRESLERMDIAIPKQVKKFKRNG